MQQTAAYGTWDSLIAANLIATKGNSIEDLLVDPVTSEVYYIEERPLEDGRNVVVALKDGRDVFGKDWNARTTVHEYGGAHARVHNRVVYFSNFADGRVYKQAVDGQTPTAVTSENKKHRFAYFSVHPQYPELIVCILEDHTHDEPVAVKNSLVVLDTVQQTVTPLVQGADFYSSPCFSQSGQTIAWIQWYHPNMPWEGGELVVARCKASKDGIILEDARIIAGKRNEYQAAEPVWLQSETLIFGTDRDGFLNPWILRDGETSPLSPTLIPEEFGKPAWFLNWSQSAVLDENRVVFTSLRQGRAVIYLCNVLQPSFLEVPSSYVQVETVRSGPSGSVLFLGTKYDSDPEIVELTFPGNTPHFKVLKFAGGGGGLPFPKTYIGPPYPVALTLPSKDPLYVILYSPTNPDYSGGLPGEKPPAIVNVHGGPTWMEGQALNWTKRFFTSRGFAWIDLNHGGSSGYGRAYRDRLNGGWGVVEVNEAAEAITQLGARGLVDEKRCAIRGGSAGGFTTLSALTTFPDAFAAGAASYGLSDLRTIQVIAHKFESHNIETLVGEPLDRNPQLWADRSPITKAKNIRAPLMILQGSIDPVVPPTQAEVMVETVREQGGRVEYVVLEGEGHGWRKAENIAKALNAELEFFQDVLVGKE